MNPIYSGLVTPQSKIRVWDYWVQCAERNALDEQKPATFKDIIGMWPGDETDEEIHAMLEELS